MHAVTVTIVLLNINAYSDTARQRKRDVLQYLPIILKIIPSCLNIDFYP